jgi:hypothetical protein
MLKRTFNLISSLNYFIQKKFFKKNKNFFFNILSEKMYFNYSINTSDIKFLLKKKDFKNTKNFFLRGDWDQKKVSLQKYRGLSKNYNSVFQIYEENKNYYDTDEYIEKFKIINEGKKTDRGQSSISELNKYFKQLDDLKNSLQLKGYLSQKELGLQNLNDEIGVVIDRNGKIIKLEDKFGGTHRFALCKILKIKKIIVNVKAVHFEFLDNENLVDLLKNFEEKKLIYILKNKLKNSI